MKIGDRVTTDPTNKYNGTIISKTMEDSESAYYLVKWDTNDWANPCWMSPTSIRINKAQIRHDKLNQLL